MTDTQAVHAAGMPWHDTRDTKKTANSIEESVAWWLV